MPEIREFYELNYGTLAIKDNEGVLRHVYEMLDGTYVVLWDHCPQILIKRRLTRCEWPKADQVSWAPKPAWARKQDEKAADDL